MNATEGQSEMLGSEAGGDWDVEALPAPVLWRCIGRAQGRAAGQARISPTDCETCTRQRWARRSQGQ